MCRINPLPHAPTSLSDPIEFNGLVAGSRRCDSRCRSPAILLTLVEPPLIDRLHLPIFGGKSGGCTRLSSRAIATKLPTRCGKRSNSWRMRRPASPNPPWNALNPFPSSSFRVRLAHGACNTAPRRAIESGAALRSTQEGRHKSPARSRYGDWPPVSCRRSRPSIPCTSRKCEVWPKARA